MSDRRGWNPTGKILLLPVSHEGYDKKLWKRLDEILGAYGPDDLVFAVETACGVWRTIVEYISRRGYTVVLESPLATYHLRSVLNNDYSKTDPKDSLLVAINARSGNCIPYRQYTPEINRLHRLGIAYSKLAKDKQKAVSRLRAAMEEVFPEYLEGVAVDTATSLHLLGKYVLPEHFQALSATEEGEQIRLISRGNHGVKTLRRMQEHAEKSVGCRVHEQEDVLRLVVSMWIAQVRLADQGLKQISAAMLELVKDRRHFKILTSIKGISDVSAALFMAECRDLGSYAHYKQIEKLAGANLKLADSGKYVGTRRISGIGNKRLLRLIYLMTAQTVRYIPEVRLKFLKRQVHRKCYRKNVMAASSQLLKLVMALIKQDRTYAPRDLHGTELSKLETSYEATRSQERKRQAMTKNAA